MPMHTRAHSYNNLNNIEIEQHSSAVWQGKELPKAFMDLCVHSSDLCAHRTKGK